MLLHCLVFFIISCTKCYAFLTKMNQQLSSCQYMVIAGLYNFHHVNFLFYASLVLTANKATVRFHSGMKCHTKRYSLLASQINFVFPLHKLFFQTHIYWHGSAFKTYLASCCTCFAFMFTQVKSTAAHIRVIIISKFLI
jgi:hypothetical protein